MWSWVVHLPEDQRFDPCLLIPCDEVSLGNILNTEMLTAVPAVHERCMIECLSWMHCVNRWMAILFCKVLWVVIKTINAIWSVYRPFTDQKWSLETHAETHSNVRAWTGQLRAVHLWPGPQRHMLIPGLKNLYFTQVLPFSTAAHLYSTCSFHRLILCFLFHRIYFTAVLGKMLNPELPLIEKKVLCV